MWKKSTHMGFFPQLKRTLWPSSAISSVVANSVQPRGLQPTRLLCPWNSPSKNTRVGSHSLLQGTFPTQGLNSGLLHCRQILHHLSHQGIPMVTQTTALRKYSNGVFVLFFFQMPIKISFQSLKIFPSWGKCTKVEMSNEVKYFCLHSTM